MTLTTFRINYFLELLELENTELTTIQEQELIQDFFLAWKHRHPTSQELLDLRSVILQKSQLIELENSHQAIDIVGTGGDNCQTFNISTAVMIVCRSLNIPIIKHGGKAVSSPSGSSDILTNLGIEHSIENSIRDWNEQKLSFLWAPQYHPVMKMVAPWREKIKEKTIFNFMGPLLHPAKNSLKYKLLGVAQAEHVEIYAQVLQKLNIQGMVVHGGMDELSTHTLNTVAYINQEIILETFIAKEVGAIEFPLAYIQVSSKSEAYDMFFDALQNKNPAAVEIIALNVAAAMQCYGILPMATKKERQEEPNSHSWIIGIQLAKKMMSSGFALKTLKNWQSLHQNQIKNDEKSL